MGHKNNKITDVPAYLEGLDIRGCVMTTDALNTQWNSAAQVVSQGGDYVLAPKGIVACSMARCASFSTG